jgi:hypothetical protein
MRLAEREKRALLEEDEEREKERQRGFRVNGVNYFVRELNECTSIVF